MNVLEIFESPTFIVALILILASVIGGCSYALCQSKTGARPGGKFDLAMSGMGTCLIAVLGFPLAIILIFALNERPLWILFLTPLLLSGWIQHRIGRYPNSLWEGTWIIVQSCIVSLMGGASIAVAVVFLSYGQFGVTLWDSPGDAYTLYYWALYIYPQLGPIAAWAWRGFKPKRGVVVDVAAEDLEPTDDF